MNAPPLALSWSQIRTHEECKQRGHLHRQGHRGPAKDIRNYFHGLVVDRIMRRWLDDPARAPGAMPAMVDDVLTSAAQDAVDDGDGVVRWRNAGDRAEVRDFCIELLTRLEPILVSLVLPYRFETAKWFTVPITVPYLDGTPTTVTLRGEMDLLVHPSSGPQVWDLKGTRDNQYYRKVIGQLVFYDIVVLAMLHRRTTVTGLIQPMCTEPVLPITVTDDARRQMWARIERVATDIWAGDTRYKRSAAGCTRCDVRHACARFHPATAFSTLGAALRHSTPDGAHP